MIRSATAMLLVAVLLLGSATTAGAEDPVIVDLQIDSPRVVTVGDRIDYTIVVDVDPGTPVEFAPAALPPELELVEPPETVRAPLPDGRERVTITFQLAPFVAGEILVPPLVVQYELQDGESGTVETASSRVDVTSVLPAAGQVTPRDLKPQAEIGTAPPTWPVPLIAGLVGLLALLLLALLVKRRFKRYRAVRARRAIPVFAGPEDVARHSLDEATAAFANTRDLTELYGSLGTAVRQYLTERYGFPAFALTTRELEAAMMDRGLDRWQVRVAGGLLEQCDAVMYAGYRPAEERADTDITAAYETVEMSRPEERLPVEQEEVVAS